MNSIIRVSFGLTCALLFGVHAPAEERDHDWPQWRGPDRTGASRESDWQPTTPTRLWTKQLGIGHSSFAISDGHVYTLGYDAEAGEDVIFCLDALTGDEIWEHRYPSEIWDIAHDGGTLTTPTVLDDLVYTSNREGKVFCFDKLTGEVKWSRDLRSELGHEPHTWGLSASPLVVDEKVILNHGRVVALDATRGEVVWHTERNFGFAYSTPAPFESNGQSMLAVLDGDGLAIVDRESGGELAFFDWPKEPSLYPMTPVIIEGDRIFISAGYDRGAAMLKLVHSESGYALESLWESRVMRNKMSGAVYWNGHLYGFDEAILKCIDIEGNELWRKRGLGTGSMSIVGGRLLIMTGRGQLVVAEARPDEFVELSQIDLFQDGTFWTTPVLSNGLAYCRSSVGPMACIDYRGHGAFATAHTTNDPALLPSAEEIISRHTELMGGKQRLSEVQSASFTGTGESLVNTVKKGPVQMHWRHGVGFAWIAASGFEYGHRNDIGWMLGTYAGPQLLRDSGLNDIVEAGDLDRLFRFDEWYKAISTKGVTQFDDRTCYVIEAETANGKKRNLYFDQSSELYAGHDGPGVHMWVVRDYTEVDGLRVPAHWRFYDPDSGEMHSATFDDIALNELVPESNDPLALPRVITLLNRTPEEIAEANIAMREKYAYLLGDWDLIDGPPPHATGTISIESGFITFTTPGQPPEKLGEPDEQERLTLLAFPDVKFHIQRAVDGSVNTINVFMGSDPAGHLERSSGDAQRTSSTWPQFRGPWARGVSTGPMTPTTWNLETGENILWKTRIPGLAHSSPVIWENMLFVTSAVRQGDGEDELKVGLYGSIQPVDDESVHDMNVYCLDRSSGDVLWQRTAISAIPKVKRHPKGSHAASTPATDGVHVVAFFGSEGLYCYDVKGNLKWKKDFGLLDSGYFLAPDAQWGFASSPVIHDGKVIVQCDVQGDSFVAALDIASGDELWKTPRQDVPSWSSPTVDVRDGRSQVICNGWKHAAGYDLETGKELWFHEGGGDIPVPTPIVVHDLIYLTSAHGREAPIRAVNVMASGDLNENRQEKIAWEQLRRGNYMQTPIVVGDILFLCADSGVLAAYEARTGEEYFRERIGAGGTGFTASIVACSDLLYITGEAGSIHVVRAGKTFEPVAANDMLEESMATPAIVDGVIYYRTRRHVVAIGQ